ncbi:thioredoxin [Periweissella cryptocerci]|uniref:Thioredoxin n=1 Tax=Periweissella cryptocerci TaxID=2506420 RepID=A0A4P6YX37_9LACO|nr:thioredoxin family protein [Periweissella cryptocerci]QBO37367.1 thioredoxin [Periweissella cryptocerci]
MQGQNQKVKGLSLRVKVIVVIVGLGVIFLTLLLFNGYMKNSIKSDLGSGLDLKQTVRLNSVMNSRNLARHRKVILVFFKSGCPDCQSVTKQVNELVQENPDILTVKLDAKSAKSKRYFDLYKVKHVPTFQRMDDGFVSKYQGVDVKKITEMFEKNE